MVYIEARLVRVPHSAVTSLAAGSEARQPSSAGPSRPPVVGPSRLTRSSRLLCLMPRTARARGRRASTPCCPRGAGAPGCLPLVGRARPPRRLRPAH
eukprot:928513-Pleurochrysis_carterae.AAC.2